MKIQFKNDYLSIKQFADLEIADFSVITGFNGSGKSHLLQAIDTGALIIENIDTSEILLYGYNDFIVSNINKSENNSPKFQNFQQKSSALSQKLNQTRNTTIQSLKVSLESGHKIPISVFTDDMFVLKNLDWTDEQISEYLIYKDKINDINRPNHLYMNDMRFHFLRSLGINFSDENARKILDNLLITGLSVVSLKNYNFNLEYFNFDIGEFDKFQALKVEFNNLQFNPEIRKEFSNSFISFITTFEHLAIQSPRLKKIGYQAFCKSIIDVFDQLKTEFESKSDPDLLKQIYAINGKENILNPIQTDHGFFNLFEIEQAEKMYQIGLKQNTYNEFLNSQDSTVNFYSDKEFEKIYGKSPVFIINKVLEEYDCNGYEFRNSDLPNQIGVDFHSQNISIYLFNKKEGFQTNLDALSSGERTLLALAFSIFKLKNKKIIAKIFLMDEIDSALHPSMSKRLINVLYNYFYKELGIKIIISTHSPSTVAFAPNESLFLMKKTPLPNLLKVTKDQALKELTSGVPSFSINYENRRQVFVESKNDVEYYENLYSIFKNSLETDISLNFISSGDARKDKNDRPVSSCDTVIQIVEVLRDAGNNSVWGIVDWDLKKNEPENMFVKVLGYEKRYSIENFLFDPLLVAILLLREKMIDPKELGLSDDFKIYDILQFNEEQCQKIINSMILKFNIIGVDNLLQINYETIGCFQLSIPQWFSTIQGHKLEEEFLRIFPELNSLKKGQEKLLKNEIINKVISDFELFAPSELLKIFTDIQKI